MLTEPYPTVTKPYGRALLEVARRRPELVCLGADLTAQTETDLFRDRLPERFFNAGMAEANLVGVAAGLARGGCVAFVNTFGVFATRRCYDQVAMAVAYPRLDVKLVGFMPGLSSPGGPSHQAIEDVALMRALPNMTVVDPADATEVAAAVEEVASRPGPVYLRLKRGEIPVIFEDDHRLDLDRAQVLREGADLTVVASGMMVATALRVVRFLEANGVDAALVHVPVIKPLDAETVVTWCARSGRAVVAENHTVVGGLGSAVAEALVEAGATCRLRRVGVPDTFAIAASVPYLFERYGLSAAHVLDAAYDLLGWRDGPRLVPPPSVGLAEKTYSPV
jgi:transketolase